MTSFKHAFLAMILTLSGIGANTCPSKVINPVTDINWSFAMNIKFHAPTVCPKMVKGVMAPVPCAPVTFWEPVYLMEVVRKPYCFMSLGGLQLGSSLVHGGVQQHEGFLSHSFYHVHLYTYPVFSLLGFLKDVACVEQGDISLPYFSELDPAWNHDEVSFLLSPEVFTFANPLAQAACVTDALKPSDALFWCSGAQGSLYPFTGTVTAHTSGVQASLLLAGRVLARMHRTLQLKDTFSSFCQDTYRPVMPKSQYRFQMVYPTPVMHCAAIGESEMGWSLGKTPPVKSEDFMYIVWRKKSCCLA